MSDLNDLIVAAYSKERGKHGGESYSVFVGCLSCNIIRLQAFQRTGKDD